MRLRRGGPVIGALIVVVALTACTSFETRDGLYRDATSEEVSTGSEETVALDEAVDAEVDIFDGEIALGGMPREGFNLGTFTEIGGNFITMLNKDIMTYLKDDSDYRVYDKMAVVVNDDLMSVVSVELEHLMQFDPGTWQNRRTEYTGGDGYIISSFEEMDGTFIYNISYHDQSGSLKEVTVTYDSFREGYDYVSESFNTEGELSYKVWQQYASDGFGGYYYQALRHSVLDNMERASFSWFDGASYQTYISPTVEGVQLSGLPLDLMEGLPGDLSELVDGFEAFGYFERLEGSFDYQPITVE